MKKWELGFVVFIPIIFMFLSMLITDLLLILIGIIGWSILSISILMIIRPFIKEAKILNLMKWKKRFRPSFGEQYHSTENERLVLMNNGVAIEIPSIGRFYVGLIRSYNEIQLIDLYPKQEDIPLAGEGWTTKEGLKLNGKLTISVKIIGENHYLKRIASNFEDEFQNFISYLKSILKSELTNYEWSELFILNGTISNELVRKIKANLLMKKVCFDLVDIMEMVFHPLDLDFAEQLKKRKKAEEIAKTKKKELEVAKDFQKIQAEIDRVALLKEQEIEINKLNHKIKQDRKLHEAELEVRSKENEYRKKVVQENLAFLEKHPKALMLINPDLYKVLELAKINSNLRHQEFLEKWMMKKNSHELGILKGQLDVVGSLSKDRLGVDIKFQDINDESAEELDHLESQVFTDDNKKEDSD